MASSFAHWPHVDSDEYSAAAETIISLLSSAGLEYNDPDITGEPVNETLQTILMDAMFRSPGIADILNHAAALAESAVIRHNSKMNSQR